MRKKQISLILLLIILLNILMPPIHVFAEGEKTTITVYDSNFAEYLEYDFGATVTPSEDGKSFSVEMNKEWVEGADYLYVENHNIKDIRGIEAFTNVKYLALTRNKIEDISPISSLTKLERIDLNNNNISDISPLNGFTNLVDLRLRGNNISDVTPLKDYEIIDSLDLSYNNISNVTPLSNIDKIHFLLLDDNNITDSSSLANLSETLIGLSLNNNKIAEINSISDLNLAYLDIGNNKIENLSSLSKMTNLLALFAKNTGVKDVSFMTALKYIEFLDLSDNKLETAELLSTIGQPIDRELFSSYLESKQVDMVRLDWMWNNPIEASERARVVKDGQVPLTSNGDNYTNPYIGDEAGTIMYVTNKGYGDYWGTNKCLRYIDLSNNYIPSFDPLNVLMTGRISGELASEYFPNNIVGYENIFNPRPMVSKITAKDPVIIPEILDTYNNYIEFPMLYSTNKVFENNAELENMVIERGLGVLNYEDQYLELKTNKTEVDLPPVFNEARELEHIVHSDESHQLENATLSSDGKKLVLDQSTNVSEAKIRLGTAEYTTFRVYHDSKAPTLIVNYSTKDLTNKNVTVTVISDKKIEDPVEGWELSESGTILTKVYSLNGTETINVKDGYGNSASQEISVNNIDKVPPTVEVSYEDNSNGTKTAILKTNEKVQMVNGWTLSEDGTELRKVYNESSNERVVVYDLAGNGTEKDVSVTIIKDSTYNITSTPKELTNTTVSVVIESDKEIVEAPEGWNLSTDKKSITKEYSDNTNETVLVKYVDGTEKEVPVVVNNIDKDKPTGDVSYSITTLTNKDVVVTIKASEKVKRPNGWDISEDGTTLTKVYKENGEETVKLVDEAGNESSVNISVKNIDKTAPSVSVKYETGDGTTKAIITANEDLNDKNENGWASKDKVTVEKTFSATTEEDVQLFDLAGNSTTVKVSPEVTKKAASQVVDNTTAPTRIPQTGASVAVKAALAGVALLIIYTFIKLQNDKELKVSLREGKKRK